MVIGHTTHDLELSSCRDPLRVFSSLWPAQALSAKELAQPGKEIMNGGDDKRSTVAVLHVGGMDFGSDQQAGSVGDDMPLAAFDFLGASKPRGPPASSGF